jgi:hypothetical protein
MHFRQFRIEDVELAALQRVQKLLADDLSLRQHARERTRTGKRVTDCRNAA